MKQGDLSEKVKALAEPIVQGLGLELVDVEYISGRGRAIVRIFIDKPGGVTLDDCVEVSREVGCVLDVEDIIPSSYNLEVSSPGLTRPLTREKDFVWALGKEVNIRTREPVEGRCDFKKVRVERVVDGMVMVVDAKGDSWEIELSNIKKARLEF